MKSVKARWVVTVKIFGGAWKGQRRLVSIQVITNDKGLAIDKALDKALRAYPEADRVKCIKVVEAVEQLRKGMR